MDISFRDPKNKILMALMESFSPGVWEHSVVSGGLACALHCGEYRSVEGLSFACPDTSSLLAVATMLEYDEVCSLAKARPMTLSRFKTGMFLRDERLGTVKALWFHEGSLKRDFGPAVFDGESGGLRVLTDDKIVYGDAALARGWLPVVAYDPIAEEIPGHTIQDVREYDSDDMDEPCPGR